jgi:hypothetical protein
MVKCVCMFDFIAINVLIVHRLHSQSFVICAPDVRLVTCDGLSACTTSFTPSASFGCVALTCTSTTATVMQGCDFVIMMCFFIYVYTYLSILMVCA